MTNLGFYGIAGLKENLSNPQDPKYFLVLNGGFRSDINIVNNGEIKDFCIQITRCTYEWLRKELAAPKVKNHRISVFGDLEVGVD